MLPSELLQKYLPHPITAIDPLVGYENKNYLISTPNRKYVLKTYPFSEEAHDFVAAETALLLELGNDSDTTRPHPFNNGEYILSLEVSGEKQLWRLLTYLEGKLIGDISEPSLALYNSLGMFLAKLDLQLGKVKIPYYQSRVFEWDIQHLGLNEKFIEYIKSPTKRSWVKYFMAQYDFHVRPHTYQLRKQVIHNDANEWNLLANGEKVTGIFDFGDAAYSFRINELAVAMTYAAYDKTEPLPWMRAVLEAYHQENPLEQLEVEVLYYLIAARLCISVCNSAFSKAQNPENAYASSSEENAWKMLEKWLKVNPLKAEDYFKASVGLPSRKVSTSESIREKRDKHLSKTLSISYQQPIQMSKAAFQFMYDESGNTFLDAYNNIPHVGHSHPKVVEAAQHQLATLNTNTRYLYDLLPRYAAKLLAKFPPSLNKVFFVNSGSAATDLAIRMARAHTAHKHIAVIEHGYHGNTQLGIDVSHYKYNNPKGQGMKEHIVQVPIPDTFRGKYNDEDAGKKYAQEAKDIIENVKDGLAAFIAEPIVGCGGQVPLAKGYLKALYPEIRKRGGICISDEVQTGFGRVGSHFWGFEQHNVVPDMVILGKPIGNGHPMGAVVCSEEIANSFEKGVEFFSSFGGNPVSCAIGLAVLEVIEEEKLQENALEVGNYYKNQLKKLQQKHPAIGDVRGSGLFIGIELIKDIDKTPHTELAQYVKNEMRKRHILISTDGPFDSVLKTKPPLCFSKENVNEVVVNLSDILLNYSK